MLVIVATYSDPIEARIACGLLLAEGIEAHLGDEHSALANWEWRLAIGGVKLRVAEEQAMHARRILQALDEGAYALGDEVDPPLLAGHLQPPDRETWSSRLAWAALVLFGVPLPWRRRREERATSIRGF
ncbi:DUF2007 domain-containing protein [Luteimonas sp. RD2P54]|uniref:DUF2007 domain-containing protein n=1 Tax=Luteimonas endophytica TaxID=3042023 RepID=A0ABT6J5H1_9GAMM|nr:DUF2007 domain-containing protein [Luteimonas endophytica]MDH5822071.1 DUF2007 domain-containing protein [Luteimonas endophytica]